MFLTTEIHAEKTLKYKPARLWRLKKHKCFLTCDRQLSRPSYHKVPELQFTGVIPNVIFPYFLDGQIVPPSFYSLSPLLWLALLYSKQRKSPDMSNAWLCLCGKCTEDSFPSTVNYYVGVMSGNCQGLSNFRPQKTWGKENWDTVGLVSSCDPRNASLNSISPLRQCEGQWMEGVRPTVIIPF